MENNKDLKQENKNNIVEFKRPRQISIGIIIALIFIVYMGFHVFSSMTKKTVTAYEVSLGTIVEKNIYQGLILRHEEIFYSDRDGTIYFYEKNKSRVGVKSRIYATDTDGSVISQHLTGNEGYRMLQSTELSGIYPMVDSFVGNFNGVNFSSVYNFKDNVNEYLTEIRVQGMASQYAGQIEAAKNAGTYFDYYAPKPGYLVYVVDGYEDKNIENIEATDFHSGSFSTVGLRSNEKVQKDSPVYKLITSDDWQIVIPIEQNKVEEFSAFSTIKIRFAQDNSTTWTNTQVMTKGDNNYLVLSLDDSMERYADQRYVNIELLLDETKGLKIPNTALVEKECFTVPKAYFYRGGNSDDLGVLVRREKTGDKFVIPTVFYENEDNYYIDDEYVAEGDKLIMENSQNVYTVGETKDKLIGVYSINKGYAYFRRVDITYQNQDYTIVKNQASYSISLYDHIVLDSSSVKENEIL